jgi:hypothetical protein
MKRVLLFGVLFLCVGCQRPWNGAHTGLEVAAEAVATTGAMVDEVMGEDPAEARQAVVGEYQVAYTEYRECMQSGGECGEEPSIELFLERYDERMEDWSAVTTALEVVGAALVTAEAGVTSWRASQQQPDDWDHICSTIHTAQGAVVRAIEACGVDVPAMWEQALNALGLVCSWGIDTVEGLTNE